MIEIPPTSVGGIRRFFIALLLSKGSEPLPTSVGGIQERGLRVPLFHLLSL
jgi:hypothetical protein